MMTKEHEIKIGILFSLTGTTGITERGQYQACLLAIKQINEKGGIDGRRLLPVVEDIASDPYLTAQKAEKLILADKVVALVGLYTSACRKMIISTLEKYDTLLFYPTQYEGEEQHRNIFYCCPVPNQQLLHFIPWIIENLGKSFYLIGSDYIYPRQTNQLIRFLVESHQGIIVGENYSSLGNQKFYQYLKDIERVNPDVIFSTLVGDSAVSFYKQFHQYGINKPIASSITAETEISTLRNFYTKGYYSSFPYFSTIQSRVNQSFVNQYQQTYGTDRISSAMENAYNSIYLLTHALERVKKLDTDSLRKALSGLSFEAPQGKIVVDTETQHLHLHSRIGKVNENGQFDILWESGTTIAPSPFFKKLLDSDKDKQNVLGTGKLEEKLAQYEVLLDEIKRSVHFLPYLSVFIDMDGNVLDTYNHGIELPPITWTQIQPGSHIKAYSNLDETGLKLAWERKVLSSVQDTMHTISQLQTWHSIGIPISSRSGTFNGVIGFFIQSDEISTLSFITNSLARIVEYAVDTVEQKHQQVSLHTILQDVSAMMSDCLYVIKDKRIVFTNVRGQQLFKQKKDFVENIMEDIFNRFPQEIPSVLRKKANHDLVEIKIVTSEPYYYVFIKEIGSSLNKSQPVKDKRKIVTKDLVGSNENFLKAVSLAKSAAQTTANVLLLGESGTGKELFARAIHNESNRCDKPFVAINCAAIPKDLINAELFGYAEGAFTGARRGGNQGKFEAANGGTLFLDEIGDMPLELQASLLRVLQEKEVTRIGGHTPIPIDVRIIAATNKNLNQEIAFKGSFRSDLYFRLNVFTIELVPLRERLDDISALVEYFIDDLVATTGRPKKELSREAFDILIKHNWYGNIRELSNVIERAFYISDNSAVITKEHLPRYIFQPLGVMDMELDFSNHSINNVQDIKQQNHDLNKKLIIKVLLKTNGNISKTAKYLGISRPTLYRKLKEYEIEL
jgi:transcriptional regulator with PAS, ATPase and Fis domain/ABC-type branched-subunit amino acid transport system substrate-binding protein